MIDLFFDIFILRISKLMIKFEKKIKILMIIDFRLEYYKVFQ